MIFCDSTGAVGLQQQPQIVDPGLQLPSLVGLRDLDPGLHVLKDEGVIGDIVVIDQRVLPAGEGLVGDDTDIVGVVDQGIARDAAGGRRR